MGKLQCVNCRFIFRYEFQTDGYDIGFGVFRKKSKERLKASEMDTILTTQRSNCHLVPEDGAVECNLPGICMYSLMLISLYVKCFLQNIYLKMRYICDLNLLPNFLIMGKKFRKQL